MITSAASGMRSERVGYVNLTITAHYRLSGQRESVTFDKQFEVMDLPNEEFIVGMDLAPELFPSDALMSLGAKWASQMTNMPTNIRRHTSTMCSSAMVSDKYSSRQGEVASSGTDDPSSLPPLRHSE